MKRLESLGWAFRLTRGAHTQIKDAVGNEYGRPKDVVGETRMAFTSLADTAFDVCFENIQSGRCAYSIRNLSHSHQFLLTDPHNAYPPPFRTQN